MFLFGVSIDPKIRLIIGALILVLGIVLHMLILAIGGAAYLAWAAFTLVRTLRQNDR
jgi:threonine/homoserine/homoserine lactone efflux protein